MRLNAEIIKAMRPCKEGYDRFLEFYPGWEGTALQFLYLDKLELSDRLWTVSMTLPLETMKGYAEGIYASTMKLVENESDEVKGIAKNATVAMGLALAAEEVYWARSHLTASLLTYTDVFLYMGGADAKTAADYVLLNDFSIMCQALHTEI